MVWHDLRLGPALRFLNICATGLRDEVIDRGSSFPIRSEPDPEALGNSVISENGVLREGPKYSVNIAVRAAPLDLVVQAV